MITLTLYILGKIFKADLEEDMFGIIGIVELLSLDIVLALSLFN